MELNVCVGDQCFANFQSSMAQCCGRSSSTLAGSARASSSCVQVGSGVCAISPWMVRLDKTSILDEQPPNFVQLPLNFRCSFFWFLPVQLWLQVHLRTRGAGGPGRSMWVCLAGCHSGVFCFVFSWGLLVEQCCFYRGQDHLRWDHLALSCVARPTPKRKKTTV